MRSILAAAGAAGLMLAGCSEQTQQSAEETVESAAADTAANTEQVLSEARDAVGGLADDLDRETAEAEADVQNESTAEAQVD